MSKERLSKLQKSILLSIKEVKDEREKTEYPWIWYDDVYKKAREKYGIKEDTLEDDTPIARALIRSINPDPIFYDRDFKSSFSRSIRNLEKKGLVTLDRTQSKEYWENRELKSYEYMGTRISFIDITERGLLSITVIDNKKGDE